MPYQINLTNGNLLTTVPDSTLVTTFAGLSLIGKGYNGYGTAFNDDVVHITENFADSVPPANPLTGQIWYNSLSGTINFYNGTSFKSISVITVSATAPASPNQGDEWFDTTNQQVYIWTGTQWLLVGPPNSSGAGLNGFVIGSVTLAGTTYYFLELYANNQLLGIVASNTLINPGITGFGNIYPGMNFVTSPTTGIVEGGIYNVDQLTVGTADQFNVDSNGNIITAGYAHIGSNASVGGSFVINSGTANAYSFPTSLGISGQVIATYANGVTYWASATSIPGGVAGSLQYNNSGAFAGSNHLTFVDGGTPILTLSGDLDATAVNASSVVISSSLLNSGSTTLNYGLSGAFTFPGDHGTSGQSLLSAGNGMLYWSTISTGGTPGGTNLQVQYNNSGAFGGATGVTINSGGTGLTLTGQLDTATLVTNSTAVVGGTLTVAGQTTLNNGTGGQFTMPTTAGASGNPLVSNGSGAAAWSAIDLGIFSSQALANPGYQKLPGGFIIQWGMTGSFGSSQSVFINFPISFPTACLTVTATTIDYGGGDRITYVEPNPLTYGFTVKNNGSQAGASWIAIGY